MSPIMPDPIRARALGAVPHGFLGRQGGVSTGLLAGLDMGTRGLPPTPELIENRRRAVTSVLPDAALVTVYQVHSADAVTVPSAGRMVTTARPTASSSAMTFHSARSPSP